MAFLLFSITAILFTHFDQDCRLSEEETKMWIDISNVDCSLVTSKFEADVVIC